MALLSPLCCGSCCPHASARSSSTGYAPTTHLPPQPAAWGRRLPHRAVASLSPAAAAAAAAIAAAATAPNSQQHRHRHKHKQQQQQLHQQHQQQQAPHLPHGLQPHQLPRHVALIMDGNSRWAARQGLPTLVGHQRGVQALRRAVIAARRWGISALTVFAFSQENWQRDAGEVAFLMDLFSATLPQQLPELQANGVRLQFIGERARLPPALQQQAAACEAATAGNADLTLTVAVGYSGQQDVADAAAALVAAACAGQLRPEDVTPALISRHLSTAAVTAQHGPPDLTIRTSGEQRLSNWMLFESAFTELCFLNVMFPDFDEEHFAEALQQYAARQRRYGRRPPKQQ